MPPADSPYAQPPICVPETSAADRPATTTDDTNTQPRPPTPLSAYHQHPTQPCPRHTPGQPNGDPKDSFPDARPPDRENDHDPISPGPKRTLPSTSEPLQPKQLDAVQCSWMRTRAPGLLQSRQCETPRQARSAAMTGRPRKSGPTAEPAGETDPAATIHDARPGATSPTDRLVRQSSNDGCTATVSPSAAGRWASSAALSASTRTPISRCGETGGSANFPGLRGPLKARSPGCR